MRATTVKTSTITPILYRVLLKSCEGYYKNITWRFPSHDSTSVRIFGNINEYALHSFLSIEIPTLYGISGKNSIHKMRISSPLTTARKPIEYDQYALLDFIEFMANNLRDVSVKRNDNSYKGHEDELIFSDTCEIFVQFQDEVNNIFSKAGLLYILTEQKNIERIIENGVLDLNTENTIKNIMEVGTKELLEEAISLFRQPNPSARKGAAEKIWDAFERLKTYYTSLDKKSSADKIVNDMSGMQTEFITLFNEEFKALTKIGNDFRIRHHETNKIDILDPNHYDYFFNRCLSLISLAIKYLKYEVVTP